MARVSLPPASLSAVDFGAPSAELDIERGLDDYFVESEAYHRVKSGAKRILIGGRGIGKSAIFKILARRERDAGSYVIELSPEDYSCELLTQTMASQARAARSIDTSATTTPTSRRASWPHWSPISSAWRASR